MSDYKAETGGRMFDLRKTQGKSQAEVAEYIGLTVAAYQNYEAGRREAGYEVLCKLADFYQVSTDYLLGRTTVREMNVLSENEPTDEECRAAGEAIANTYDQLPTEVKRAFVEFMEGMFGDIFGRLSGEGEQEPEEEAPPQALTG